MRIATMLGEVRDSKRITTDRKRARLTTLVRAVCQADVAVDLVGVEELATLHGDTTRAGRIAACRAIALLPEPPDYVLLDGQMLAPELPVQHALIVHGDALCLSIAAASLVVKVARDTLMRALDAQYPAYGFGRHKGYGVPAHFAAIAQLDPLPGVHHDSVIHRRKLDPAT